MRIFGGTESVRTPKSASQRYSHWDVLRSDSFAESRDGQGWESGNPSNCYVQRLIAVRKRYTSMSYRKFVVVRVLSCAIRGLNRIIVDMNVVTVWFP